MVGKADPGSSQGFAAAGQKPPALGTPADLPSDPKIREKGLSERLSLIERLSWGSFNLNHKNPRICTKYAIGSYILHMWILRDVEARLKRSAKTRPVIVLTGARQTGKTSTFRHLFPDYGFVSLDLPTEAEQAEKEPERFLQRHPPPVIIDEVQYAPGLFRHLEVAVDAHRTRNGQFLLTGSQKFTLMKNVSESLAGRADIVELETLSFAEILGALPKAEIEASIVRGGFPELYANPDIDSVAFYNSYLATYLERDVLALANVAVCGTLSGFCAPAPFVLQTC
jgi:hypothetical protein